MPPRRPLWLRRAPATLASAVGHRGPALADLPRHRSDLPAFFFDSHAEHLLQLGFRPLRHRAPALLRCHPTALLQTLTPMVSRPSSWRSLARVVPWHPRASTLPLPPPPPRRRRLSEVPWLLVLLQPLSPLLPGYCLRACCCCK
jgi:hypothetical protein